MITEDLDREHLKATCLKLHEVLIAEHRTFYGDNNTQGHQAFFDVVLCTGLLAAVAVGYAEFTNEKIDFVVNMFFDMVKAGVGQESKS